VHVNWTYTEKWCPWLSAYCSFWNQSVPQSEQYNYVNETSYNYITCIDICPVTLPRTQSHLTYTITIRHHQIPSNHNTYHVITQLTQSHLLNMAFYSSQVEETPVMKCCHRSCSCSCPMKVRGVVLPGIGARLHYVELNAPKWCVSRPSECVAGEGDRHNGAGGETVPHFGEAVVNRVESSEWARQRESVGSALRQRESIGVEILGVAEVNDISGQVINSCDEECFASKVDGWGMLGFVWSIETCRFGVIMHWSSDVTIQIA
jgi:hypothetical protein